MQVEEELSRLSPEQDTLLTIGVFDGVHLGHKKLISKLIEQARGRNLLSGIVTFGQHPQDLLSPQKRLSFLSDLDEKIGLLKDEGVDIVVPLSFTAELAHLGARQFVGLLQEHLRMRGLVVGPDFALGRGREGDIDTMRKLSHDMGFSLTVIPPAVIDGEVASSTVIRGALAVGDVVKAQKLTGRPFSLHGQVVCGTGRGAGLGFPTANLDISPTKALPADGVYASRAYVNGKIYPSMTNIGRCPTFGGGERTVEVYVADYRGDLYSRDLKIDIIDRLRDEKQFDNIDELKEQLAEDVRQGRDMLSSRSGG